MSFFDAGSSFFLDAIASNDDSPIVQILPLSDNDVLQYLDDHPETFYKYFEEHGEFGKALLRRLAREHLGGTVPTTRASPQPDDLDMGEPNFPVEESCSIDKPGISDRHTAIEELQDEDDNERGIDVNVYDVSPTNIEPVSSTTVAPSMTPTDDTSQEVPSDPNPSSAPSGSTAQQPKKTWPPSNNKKTRHLGLWVYPAPPDLVEKSETEEKSTKGIWRLFEEEACIKHMLAIRDENVLKGEARFHEAQRRMKEIDEIEKTGETAVKNFWNRAGRERSGWDERKKKSDVLSTSQQGKAAKKMKQMGTKTSKTVASRASVAKRKGTRSLYDKRLKKHYYAFDEDDGDSDSDGDDGDDYGGDDEGSDEGNDEGDEDGDDDGGADDDEDDDSHPDPESMDDKPPTAIYDKNLPGNYYEADDQEGSNQSDQSESSSSSDSSDATPSKSTAPARPNRKRSRSSNDSDSDKSEPEKATVRAPPARELRAPKKVRTAR
jgi:hypothetical protein